jgi:hypothetical protein
VVARFRPLNDREKSEMGFQSCVKFDAEDKKTCAVQGTDPETGQFG